MMRIALVFAVFALGAASSRAQERPAIAVFPAIVSEVVRAQFGEGGLEAPELTRQLEEAIRATRRFSIYERSGDVLRGSVLVEQDFAKAGQALRDAAASGQLNNVQFIALPLITHVSVSARRTQREENPGQYVYKAAGSLAVTLKLLDTTSGEIMFQTTREARLTAKNRIGAAQSGPEDLPLVRGAAWRELSTEMAGRLANALVASLFPIQVMRVQGADIFVNRGEGAGVKPGEVYQIFSIGEPLIDPATNEKIGEAEELLGEVELVRVNPRFSVARARTPLAGPVRVKDVLRPPQ